MIKNLPAIQETLVCSLGWKVPLEKGMTTHSSILAGEFLDMFCSQALKQQIELPREDLRSQILYLEAVKVEGII